MIAAMRSSERIAQNPAYRLARYFFCNLRTVLAKFRATALDSHQAELQMQTYLGNSQMRG